MRRLHVERGKKKKNLYFWRKKKILSILGKSYLSKSLDSSIQGFVLTSISQTLKD